MPQFGSAEHGSAGNFPDAYEFHRNVHSLKDSGGTFGFPLVTVIAHRLEDYMHEMEATGEKALEGIQVFVDRMRDNIDGQTKSGADDGAEIARSLPIAGVADCDVIKVDMEVMLISPKDTASRIVSKELQECGFRVVNVPSPFVALEQIALTKPDLAIATAVLDGLTGVDLACAVRAMRATHALHFALITSFEPGHDALKALSKDVPVNRKGPDLPDDLAATRGVKLLVNCSSISVYEGLSAPPAGFRENNKVEPTSPYGRTKLAAEFLATLLDCGEKTFGVSLRLAGIHGAGRRNGVVFRMMSSALEGSDIRVDEPDSVFRILFMEDAVRAIETALGRPQLGHHCYNVAAAKGPQISGR